MASPSGLPDQKRQAVTQRLARRFRPGRPLTQEPAGGPGALLPRAVGRDSRLPSLGLSQTLSMIPSPSVPSVGEVPGYPTSDSLLDSIPRGMRDLRAPIRPLSGPQAAAEPAASSLRSRFSLNARSDGGPGRVSDSPPGGSTGSHPETVRRISQPPTSDVPETDITRELKRLMGGGDGAGSSRAAENADGAAKTAKAAGTAGVSPSASANASHSPLGPAGSLGSLSPDAAASLSGGVADPIIASILRRRAGDPDPGDLLEGLNGRDREFLSSLFGSEYSGYPTPTRPSGPSGLAPSAVPENGQVSYEELERAVLLGSRVVAGMAPPLPKPRPAPDTAGTEITGERHSPEGKAGLRGQTGSAGLVDPDGHDGSKSPGSAPGLLDDSTLSFPSREDSNSRAATRSLSSGVGSEPALATKPAQRGEDDEDGHAASLSPPLLPARSYSASLTASTDFGPAGGVPSPENQRPALAAGVAGGPAPVPAAVGVPGPAQAPRPAPSRPDARSVASASADSGPALSTPDPFTAAQARAQGARTHTEVVRALEREIAAQERIIAEYRHTCEAAALSSDAQDQAPGRTNADYAELQRELLQQRVGAQKMEQEWSATVQRIRDELSQVLEERASLDGFLRDLNAVLFGTDDYRLDRIFSRVSQLASWEREGRAPAVPVAPGNARAGSRIPTLPGGTTEADDVIIYQLEKATEEITGLRSTIARQEAEIGRLRGLAASKGGANAPSAALAAAPAPAAAPANTAPPVAQDRALLDELEHLRDKCAQLEEARAADRQRLRLLEREHIRKVEALEKQWEETQALSRESYERRLEGAAARLRAAETSGELLQKEKVELELALDKMRQQRDGEDRLAVEKRLQSLENQGESLLVKDATEKLAMARQELERERREFQKALLDRKIELGGYREELTDILAELSRVLGQ